MDIAALKPFFGKSVQVVTRTKDFVGSLGLLTLRRHIDKERAMRFWWCAIAAFSLASCGYGSGVGAGGAMTAAPLARRSPHIPCNTRTEMVLVDPIPGSGVPANTRSIVIVSNFLIPYSNAALAALNMGSKVVSSSHLLAGPVAAPSPPPFPTPAPPFAAPYYYYESSGFRLKPKGQYQVELAMPGSGCSDSPIPGAIFRTATKHKKSSAVQIVAQPPLIHKRSRL